MKKYLFSVILFICLFGSLPGLALAQQSNMEDSLIIFGDNTILPNAELTTVVSRLINAALTLAGLILTCIFLYGGLIWMLALGDETKVEKAKGAMMQGVIGLVIIVMSYSIATWVLDVLNRATGS